MFRGLVFNEGEILEYSGCDDIKKDLKKSSAKIWIDLEDPTESEIDFIVDEFDFHPLSIEDAMIQKEHPKLDEFDDYNLMIFYSAKMINGEVKLDQISAFYGKNFVITLHEERIKGIDRVFSRAKGKSGKTANFGIDWIMHALLDNFVDEYFPLIEKIEDKLDEYEDRILERREGTGIMDEIMGQKKNILFLRKLKKAEKPVLGRMMKAEPSYIRKTTLVYFRDVYDHLNEISGTLENMRDIIPSLMDAYNGMLMKKSNDSIHKLTVVATIAVPLTVITSYFGQNIWLPFADMGVMGNIIIDLILICAAVAVYLFATKLK